MSVLHRELAPVGAEAWQVIDEEARRTLRRLLAGRRLVDFVGPLGYGASAVERGRIERVESTHEGVAVYLRSVQNLVEHHIEFELARAEIEAIERGAKDPDLGPIVQAAQVAARAEDSAIFSGHDAAGIEGMLTLAAAYAVPLTTDYERYPFAVASALTGLRHRGVEGPYAMALGPRCYQGLTETVNKGGYPILDLVRQQLDGEIVWAPAVDGAAVISTRGGDFELHVGRDYAIGYVAHNAERVRFFLEVSFTFMAHTPDAVVPLVYESPEAIATQ